MALYVTLQRRLVSIGLYRVTVARLEPSDHPSPRSTLSAFGVRRRLHASLDGTRFLLPGSRALKKCDSSSVQSSLRECRHCHRSRHPTSRVPTAECSHDHDLLSFFSAFSSPPPGAHLLSQTCSRLAQKGRRGRERPRPPPDAQLALIESRQREDPLDAYDAAGNFKLAVRGWMEAQRDSGI
ncbi:hypothetical protein C8R44DRAFT_974131 [Mycena epipterygia]|nr:hypothetical protein C8R44DRAFT_974131 [Mycena epipterygia]